MGYSSQSGQVVFRRQTAKGTAAADIGTKGVAMPFRSGGLAGNREFLVPDAEIGGGRDVRGGLLGTISFSGDFEYYARLDSITTQIQAALGVATSEAGTAPNAAASTHTITPSDGQLPFYTIYERISNGLLTSQYKDCVANTFHFEVEPNGQLSATTGWIGSAIEIDAPALTGVDALFDNGPMIAGTNVTVSYGGVEVPAKSFSFDVSNNVEDDDFRLGSFFLADLTAKQREVTAAMTLRHENAKLLKQALFGSETATTVSCATTSKPLVVTANTCQVISGTSLTGQLKLTVPQAIVEPFAFEPSGDDVIESEVTLRAVRPSLGTPICTVEVRNGKTEIA